MIADTVDISSIEYNIALKIVKCIKSNLCRHDEDYDKPIISPKFLNDYLDQMMFDDFETVCLEYQ